PAYTGTTTINAGDVQVDGIIGAVVLGDGSVSGTGQIGAVTVTVSMPPAKGGVAPGDNGAPNPIGTLTSPSVTLGSGSTFSVDIKHTTVGSPIPGVDNDLLFVNGNVSPNRAPLLGTVGTGVAIHHSVPILTYRGTLTGNFAEPFGANFVFISGQKFTVDYGSRNGTPTVPGSIVLNRVKNNANVVITSSLQPSQYGQDVVFTATVTPEPGASALPPGGTVSFSADSGTIQLPLVPINGSGQATFNPQQVGSLTFSVGTHGIAATYKDSTGSCNDANAPPIGPGLPAFQQIVNRGATTTTVSSSVASPVFGQSVTFTATITPVNTPVPGRGAFNPGGTVTF